MNLNAWDDPLAIPWLQVHPAEDTLHYLRIEEGSAVSLRMNGQMLGTTTMDGSPPIPSWCWKIYQHLP
jgi:hypothetical protein